MSFQPYKALAMVHSLQEKREVLIVSFTDNNNCQAVFENKFCTAIYNPFVGCFYVDDVYGVIEILRSSKAEKA